MKKTIVMTVLAVALASSASTSFAQDVQTDESRLAQEYYSALYGKKDTLKAEGLKSEILAKYPKEAFARRLSAEAVNMASDSLDYIRRADEFRNGFPISEWIENPDGQGFVYMNFYRNYARMLYASRQWDKLREIMPEMTYSMLSDLYAHGPMFYIMKAPVDPREYVDIAQDIISEMWRKKDMDIDMYSATAETRSGAESMKYYLAVQTEVLQRSGRPEDAVECMEKICPEDRYNQYPAGNEAYVAALESMDRNQEATDAIIGSAAVGRLTPVLFSKLRKYYLSSDPKPAPTFDDYYSSLKTDKARENLRAAVQAGLMDEPFDTFSLTSIDGKIVDYSTFGPDDIVVLDFWATWCAPCIAALAGMQLAVEKYASDEHVHFYFICTQDEPDKDRVERIWAKGKYHDMTVLFDECRDGGKEYDKVYRSIIHGTSGIPQKAVLKDGRVRYVAEGYGGSPSELMDEISAVIEILKTE